MYCISSKPKLSGRHIQTSLFLCPDLLVRQHHCNIWPCTNSRSFNSCACGSAHTAKLCLETGSERGICSFYMQKLRAFLCLSLLKRQTAYPKTSIIKMKKLLMKECDGYFTLITNSVLLGEVFTQKQLFSVYIQQNTVGSNLTAVFQEIAEMGLKWIEAHDGNTETSRMLQTIEIIPSQ